jgi:hypothetical protein
MNSSAGMRIRSSPDDTALCHAGCGWRVGSQPSPLASPETPGRSVLRFLWNLLRKAADKQCMCNALTIDVKNITRADVPVLLVVMQPWMSAHEVHWWSSVRTCEWPSLEGQWNHHATPLTAAGKAMPKAGPGAGAVNSTAQEMQEAKDVLAKCGIKGAAPFCD